MAFALAASIGLAVLPQTESAEAAGSRNLYPSATGVIVDETLGRPGLCA